MQRILMSTFLLINAFNLNAQIKPDVSIAVPNATGTVTTPYQPTDYDTGTLVNYIRTWQPQQPTADAIYVGSSSRTIDEVNVTTQYFDGLGRPLQTVNWQASPDKKDIVAPVVYDEFGRETYQFLPYTSPTASASGNPGQFKMNPFSEQSTFYTSTYKTEQPAIANEKYFYSKTNFEPSPLNRVSESYAPGNSWAGSELLNSASSSEKKVSVQYLVNTRAADAVRIWHIDFNTTIEDNIPSTNDTYADGQLYKTVTLDEAGNATVEYKDKEGQVILKKVQIGTIATDYSGYSGFLCTYYVYDDLNQLRTVLQPKAVVAALGNNWVITPTVVNELGFRYEYDGRQRMIAKKVPGAGWVYMVYDVRDRLAFSQDANMNSKHQWMYTMYDDLNRPIQTGIMNYAGNRETLQSAMPTTSSSSTVTNTGTSQTINPADLYINGREYGRTDYKATTSIIFDNGFISEDNASFTAEIVTEAANNFSDGNVTVNTFYKPNDATLIPLTYTYYDDYAATAKTYSPANNPKLDAGGNPYPETLPSTKSDRTRGMVTVTKVRVIEDPNNLTLGKWLETVNFYDDKGRVIQVQSTNYKGGNDIVTNRYDFTGKVVSSYVVHENVSGNVSNMRVLTSMNYDHAGRLKTVTKTINDDDNHNKRVIATNSYDALGKLKNKKTGQKSAEDATALEDDNYNYNIRGWLKDINWYSSNGTYASQMNNSPAINKWFSMDLSYDWGFDNNASQYNGNISGTRWKTAGDGEERAYGFAYDKANRLLKGDFNQNNSGWNHTKINFSMQLGDDATSTPAYDENGNIKFMRQYGLQGVTSGIIDEMTYTYKQTNQQSNQLLAVRESDNIGTTDNKLGDFTDKSRTADDYDYDDNGNLIYDKNKKITSIEYNHLNLPWKITVNNDDDVTTKGTITYIYDAAGNKLEKRTNETALSKQTNTTYLSGFVYDNNVLQFFGHEEGRVRYKQFIDDNNQPQAGYVYDYFIKDHLGNVRMVLTEEEKRDKYPAVTYETANLPVEQDYYDNVDVQRTDRPGPFFSSGTNGDKVQLLRKSSVAVGAAKLLKVMTADKIEVKVDYYIPTQTTDNNDANGLNSILSSLLSLLDGVNAPAALKGSGATITDDLNNFIPFKDLMEPQGPGIPSSLPKAYLNIVFFDEQFKFVEANSQAIPANVMGTPQSIIRIEDDAIAAQKNGYVYIYVSNESNNMVYFDNLQITHIKGPLLEETHYYPFGLTMAGISSKALNNAPTNRYKYNGIEQNTDFDLNTYETNLRNLDPQIGRWWSIDSRPNVSISSYASMDNNPVRYADPLGDTAIVKWRSGFLGLGGGHEGRYVGGQWIDSKSRNAISASKKGAQRLMSDYNTLNGDKNFNPVTDAINNSINAVNLNSGAGPGSGGSETNTPKYFGDLANGVANPDIDVYAQKSESLPGKIFEKGKGSLPSYIILGHELGHAWDILNSGTNRANFTQMPGLAPGISKSEMNAMYWENVLRKDAKMNLRLWYHYDQNTSPQFQLKANVNYVPVPFIGIITIMSDLNKTNSQIRF